MLQDAQEYWEGLVRSGMTPIQADEIIVDWWERFAQGVAMPDWLKAAQAKKQARLESW